jgi:hypothetical protein
MKAGKASRMMVLAGMLAAGAVNASVITNFYDDFSGSSAAALNGTGPDIRPGTETWTASSVLPAAIRADGSFGYNTNAIRSAYLPVQIEANKKYTLTAILNISNADSNTDSAGIGFLNVANTGNYALSTNAALIVRRNGQAQAISTGGSVATSITTPYNLSNPVDLKIVLDTTPTVWTAEYFINGSSVATKTLSSSFSAGLNYINLGKSTTTEGSFDEFKLTVIPEPATLGIFVLGSASLMFLRKHLVR